MGKGYNFISLASIFLRGGSWELVSAQTFWKSSSPPLTLKGSTRRRANYCFTKWQFWKINEICRQEKGIFARLGDLRESLLLKVFVFFRLRRRSSKTLSKRSWRKVPQLWRKLRVTKKRHSAKLENHEKKLGLSLQPHQVTTSKGCNPLQPHQSTTSATSSASPVCNLIHPTSLHQRLHSPRFLIGIFV